MLAVRSSPARFCSGCRQDVLRSFISLVKPTVSVFSGRTFATTTRVPQDHNRSVSRSLPGRSQSVAIPTRRICQHSTASFATSSTHQHRSVQEAADDEAFLAELNALEEAEEEELSNRLEGRENPDYIPWYLQGKADAPASSHHVFPGQDMPDLPEHSPTLLQPVVSHVLETLGMTFLKVLDLRTVADPPPALGSNLIMVLATARSQRHLHASADRFCRWLRSEHKLTPFADGLLGRNEMKIAVRRRVRRAKMMTAAGAGGGDAGDITDGIRNGWICVNVGRVEGGVLPEMEQARDRPSFVGFGTTSNTTTVVVQMMTEEKREELQLEALWSETKRRQDRKRLDIADAPAEDPKNTLDDIWPASDPPQTPGLVREGSDYSPSSSETSTRQTSTYF